MYYACRLKDWNVSKVRTLRPRSYSTDESTELYIYILPLRRAPSIPTSIYMTQRFSRKPDLVQDISSNLHIAVGLHHSIVRS